MNISRTRKCRAGGYTLLEVLIGMVIFAIGMMALVQLQGNLSKSSADSNARSVATNLAEETMEAARSFSQVTGGNGVNAFNNIVTAPLLPAGGINYSARVTDYYYQPPGTVNGTGTFTTTNPATRSTPT
jgi:prepilin-type N-terminal cleavage/methylation domain-containing protein